MWATELYRENLRPVGSPDDCLSDIDKLCSRDLAENEGYQDGSEYHAKDNQSRSRSSAQEDRLLGRVTAGNAIHTMLSIYLYFVTKERERIGNKSKLTPVEPAV